MLETVVVQFEGDRGLERVVVRKMKRGKLLSYFGNKISDLLMDWIQE